MGRVAAVVALLLLAAACSPQSERLRQLRSPHADCTPGTFLGSMTGNCPERVRPPS